MARKKTKQPYYVGEVVRDGRGNILDITSVQRPASDLWRISFTQRNEGHNIFANPITLNEADDWWEVITPAVERLWNL